MAKLTIGRVAAAEGVNVETIRYYQRRGLLEEPMKPLGGYRDYPTEVVKQVRFIKSAEKAWRRNKHGIGRTQNTQAD